MKAKQRKQKLLENILIMATIQQWKNCFNVNKIYRVHMYKNETFLVSKDNYGVFFFSNKKVAIITKTLDKKGRDCVLCLVGNWNN